MAAVDRRRAVRPSPARRYASVEVIEGEVLRGGRRSPRADAVPVTDARVGVVDVYVLRRAGDRWEVLLLERGSGTRCPGSWETVHGRIEPGERPEEAALREVREETGLGVERLYNATVQPFYLHGWGAVMLSVVFAAVVAPSDQVTLGPEHRAYEWLSPTAALERYSWPRSKTALSEILFLLRRGDAGEVEDVLRVH